MSILYGLYRADAGEIRVDGKAGRDGEPARRHRATASAWSTSISCWSTPSPCWRTWCWAPKAARCWPAAWRRRGPSWRGSARDYGLAVDPDAPRRRPVGRRAAAGRDPEGAVPRRAHPDPRRAERRADAAGDRPAASASCATLQDRGVTVVLITHKLREIMAVTDQVYRDAPGRRWWPSAAPPRPIAEELAELMVGRKVRLELDKAPARNGRGAADGRASVAGRRPRRAPARRHRRSSCAPARSSASPASPATARRELLQVLAGIRPPTGGTPDGLRPRDRRAAIPAIRRRCATWASPMCRRTGCARAWWRPSAASETSILGYQDRDAVQPQLPAGRPGVGDHCAELMERFDVRPRAPGLRSSNFSGGNQQKLVLAREMAREPKVLLVGQPTRGVDIGAIEFIHRELVEEPRRGLRRAGRVGRARRDPVAGRPHPGDVRRPHRGRGRGRRAPTSARSA